MYMAIEAYNNLKLIYLRFYIAITTDVVYLEYGAEHF